MDDVAKNTANYTCNKANLCLMSKEAQSILIFYLNTHISVTWRFAANSLYRFLFREKLYVQSCIILTQAGDVVRLEVIGTHEQVSVNCNQDISFKLKFIDSTVVFTCNVCLSKYLTAEQLLCGAPTVQMFAAPTLARKELLLSFAKVWSHGWRYQVRGQYHSNEPPFYVRRRAKFKWSI